MHPDLSEDKLDFKEQSLNQMDFRENRGEAAIFFI